MSTQTLQQFAVTYGQISGRGGWLIQAQDVIEASCMESALNRAYYVARKYHDRVLDVRPIMYDKELLDYDNEEVI